MATEDQFEYKTFVFKITLRDSSPEIWRRFYFPPTHNFEDLGEMILGEMGWWGYHLHKFEMVDPVLGDDVVIVPKREMDHAYAYGPNIVDECEAKIYEYFTASNSSGVYIYDFGDNWEHVIELEEIIDHNDVYDCVYQGCVAGEGLCPPEDSGGVYGYKCLLEILNDPNHPQHEEMKEWVKGTQSGDAILAGDKYEPPMSELD